MEGQGTLWNIFKEVPGLGSAILLGYGLLLPPNFKSLPP